MLQKLPAALGHALRGQRAGLEKLAINKLAPQANWGGIEVASTAFADHTPIPARYTADGEGVSPPLHWSGVPPDAAGLVLLVEDADSPTPQPLVHAIVVALDAGDGALPEGALSHPDGSGGAAFHMGQNSFLQPRWLPPDPPPGHGPHRYAFQLFALARLPQWSAEPGREEVMQALEAGAVASGCCIGLYQRGLEPAGSLPPQGAVA